MAWWSLRSSLGNGLESARFAAAFGILEAVAFALRPEDVATVCEAFTAEDFGPIFKREIGGHDQAVPFIRGGDDVEQQFGSGLAGGDVAEFVEDQQVNLVQLLPVSQKLAFLFCLQQLGDEFGDAEEPHLAALSTCGHAEGCGEVRFAGA